MKFNILKELNSRGRVGVIETEHGNIDTPAFIVVGTKASVKSLSPEQVTSIGSQAILANTYHLYLQPGHKLIERAKGLNSFMNWNKPTFTDSGGFQAFSLGIDFDNKIGKIGQGDEIQVNKEKAVDRLAKVTEDGVEFKSIIDGSIHFFTPEKSIEIQHSIGADIIFAFDECTSPYASYEYQKEAMDRTHRWAKRSLDYHLRIGSKQALFGIVQGGRHKDLREESARYISQINFDGFGIGGSFDKEDIYTAVGWVNDILPKEKPRHLLGIGEPIDLFGGIENGIDTFDCVTPTRIARNGALYTKNGRINILNAKYIDDFESVEKDCVCYTCKNYTKAYLSHLFRSKEMFASTLASIHNLYFIVNLVKNIRQSIIDDTFIEFKKDFLKKYYKDIFKYFRLGNSINLRKEYRTI